MDDFYIQWLLGDAELWFSCSVIGILSAIACLFLHGFHKAKLEADDEINNIRWRSGFIAGAYSYLMNNNSDLSVLCHINSIINGDSIYDR